MDSSLAGFLDKVFDALSDDGINVVACELDHVCWRVESEESYAKWKEILNKKGNLLSEAIIAQRPISTFRLHKPLHYLGREIQLVELPAPGKKQYAEGWEHAEFVIQESFQDFMDRNEEVQFDTSSMLKAVNPDVKRIYGGFSVKFHQQSLDKVIAYELSFKNS